MSITKEWFIKTFEDISEMDGNSETLEDVKILTEDGHTIIEFSVDCDRYGLHRHNKIKVDNETKIVKMYLAEIIEGGDIEYGVKAAIENKIK